MPCHAVTVSRHIAVTLALVLLAGCAGLPPTPRAGTQPQHGESSVADAPPARPQIQQPAPPLPAAATGKGGGNSAVVGLLRQAAEARQSGDLQKAQALAERAQGFAPRQPQSYLELAQIYRQRGDAARARQMALRGLQFAGSDDGLRGQLEQLTGDHAASP